MPVIRKSLSGKKRSHKRHVNAKHEVETTPKEDSAFTWMSDKDIISLKKLSLVKPCVMLIVMLIVQVSLLKYVFAESTRKIFENLTHSSKRPPHCGKNTTCR